MLLTIESIINNIIQPINFLLPGSIHSFLEIYLLSFYIDEILVIVMSLSLFSFQSVSEPLGDVVIVYSAVGNLIPLPIENAPLVDLAFDFLVLNFSDHFLGYLLFRLVFLLLLIQLVEFFSPNFSEVIDLIQFSGL